MIVEKRSAVQLDHTVQADDKVGVCGTERETAGIQFHQRFGFGRRRRVFLVQLALTFENPNLLVEFLDLLLVGVGDRLLFRFALLFEALDLLIQCLYLFLQGFNLRRFRGVGGRAAAAKASSTCRIRRIGSLAVRSQCRE